MRKILIWLEVIQERKHKDPFNITYKKRRINPYNPLSYLTIVVSLLMAAIMFGLVGMWNEIPKENIFKWK